MGWNFPCKKGNDLFYCLHRHGIGSFPAQARAVGGTDHIFQLDERSEFGGLFLENIQACSGNPAVRKRFVESLFLHNLPPGGIDEEGRRFHQLQPLLPDHQTGGIIQRNMEGYVVGHLEEFFFGVVGDVIFLLEPGIIHDVIGDDFDLKPGSANSIEPGKRMLSSMSPTLVLDREGRPFMALGSPGATRIIPTVAQVISNVIDRGMPIQLAIQAPRLYQSRSGNLSMEGRYSINAFNGVKALGHEVTVGLDYDAVFGGVHAVLYDHVAKILYGGADPRRDGQAAAY